MLISIVCIVCGGEITTPGQIKFPADIVESRGNNEYPNSENCTWIIRAPPRQVIQLVYVLGFDYIFFCGFQN